jgi:hypothetical protein
MTIEQTIDIMPNRRIVFDLPMELPIGRAKMELTITPEVKAVINKDESAFGCLNRFADPSKIPYEEGAWAKAVQEKYANNWR